MKALFISLLVLTISLIGFAQSTCNIKKAYAFYHVSMPGVQMADENGNPIPPKANITRFIYVEYSGTKKPDIKTILYNNTQLSFSVVSVKAKMVSVGDKKLNPENNISARKGNSFLKIDLQPAEGKTMPDADCKNIVITSKLGNKVCKFYVVSEKEFVSPPSY